jgi:hypothetical protein
MLRFVIGMALILMMSVPVFADSYRDYDEPARAKHPLTIRSGRDHDRYNDNEMAMTRQLLVHLLSNYDDRSSLQKSDGRNAWKYPKSRGGIATTSTSRAQACPSPRRSSWSAPASPGSSTLGGCSADRRRAGYAGEASGLPFSCRPHAGCAAGSGRHRLP